MTGTHAIKTGMTFGWGTNSTTRSAHGEIQQLNFNNNNPLSVVVRNTPYSVVQKVNADFGLYAQDAWTMKRLTLNYGGRFDHFNSEVPRHYSDPTPWVPFVRDFAAIENVPNWNDWAIRLAGSYDLFGTGKTALKANVSKYMAAEAASYAANFNPMAGDTDTRAWTDLDGNRTILDANGNIQYNEVAAGRRSNFGTLTGSNRPDPDLDARLQLGVLGVGAARADAEGVGHRRLLSPEIRQPARERQPEHQPDNATTIPSTSSGRADSRFPTGGGEAITMYSLNQSELGTPSDTLVTFSTSNNNIYNGFDVGANARFGRGFFFAGVTTERSETLNCDVRDNPNSERFCDNVPPFRAQFKGSAAYTIPWDIQVERFVQFNARHQRLRQLSGDICDRGTHDLTATSGGTQQINVNLIEPNTLFLDRMNQINARARQDVPVRPLPGAGLHGHLQRAERRHGDERQHDLRRQPGHAHLDEPGDDSHRPHDPVRHAVGVLGNRGIGAIGVIG